MLPLSEVFHVSDWYCACMCVWGIGEMQLTNRNIDGFFTYMICFIFLGVGMSQVWNHEGLPTGGVELDDQAS